MKSSLKRAALFCRNRRGIALITVVTLLALATVLLLAVFSSTQTELKATSAYASGANARQTADIAVNLVIGQLQRATRQDDDAIGREIWSSQPGMVRQYRESGRLLRGLKLYSSNQMIVQATADTDNADAIALASIVNDVAPTSAGAAWNSPANKSKWIDMNEPRVEEGRVIFPIIDPRAYSLDPTKSVEGFTYFDKVDGATGLALPGVRLPMTGTAEDDQRLPMPVQWLYVLRDGTLGYIGANNNFVGAGGEAATITNPIVSRVAFWTDDETCKININTAGEGTPWDTPRLYHDRDGDWARFQPMMYEYQRYPGHPSTVAMSTVLFPNVPINTPRSNGTLDTETAGFSAAVARKEAIYDLMPKILPGGSRAGSVLVPVGRVFNPTDFNNVKSALSERLFASVDEFILRPQMTGVGGRDEIDPTSGTLWPGLTRAQVVERLGFFLTPNSRAPETNPFGLPKIAMWPIWGNNSATISASDEQSFRTVFDRMIARVSTLAGSEYFFRRNNSSVSTEAGLYRNPGLLTLLTAMTDAPIPGFGANGATFGSKYGDNRDQILTEIFDYIRSTNLYDDTIAMQALGTETPSVNGGPGGRPLAGSSGMASKTFTAMRSAKRAGDTGQIGADIWPGHGQVVPTQRSIANGVTTRGMGRYTTISEVGLHFICCAEGTAKAGGKHAQKQTVATRDFLAIPADSPYQPTDWHSGMWRPVAATPSPPPIDRWYSNFPPLTNRAAAVANNWYKTKYPTDNLDIPEGYDAKGADPWHPGYNPAYWNWTLQKDTPLAPGTKRVQAAFEIEWFIPSAGWSAIHPNFEVVVDASALTIYDSATDTSKRMFPTNAGSTVNGLTTVKLLHQMNSAWEMYIRGGTVSPRGLLQGKLVRGGFTNSAMPEDVLISSSIPGYSTPTPAVPYANAYAYDLVSEFFDIPANQPIQFSGGDVKIEIKEFGATSNTAPYQTYTLRFPSGQFPTPELVVYTERPYANKRADGTGWDTRQMVPPPYWWSFHRDGALGRREDGTVDRTNANSGDRRTWMGPELVEFGGRFRYAGDEVAWQQTQTVNSTIPDMTRGNLATRYDVIRSMVISHGDPRLIMGKTVVGPEFVPHRLWDSLSDRIASNITYGNQQAAPYGTDRGNDKAATDRFIKGATYPERWIADVPQSKGTTDTDRIAVSSLRKYGDFDRGIANMEDGAYINKPDEGNSFVVWTDPTQSQKAVPYFTNTYISWSGGGAYFSPNRQVASPGMFGSLPTGVFESSAPGGLGRKQEGWRTLFFRPQLVPPPAGNSAHPGAPATIKWTSTQNGRQAALNNFGVDPPDYLMMDFFWMPVVEPYAISEPGSTAGKINMNYQMAPFRHIRRATALQAAMKSEMIHAVPLLDAGSYLSRPSSPAAPPNRSESWFHKDADGKYWHREIDPVATLKVFDDRFRCGFNFISPAQICEMYLLPKKGGANDTATGSSPPANWGTTQAAVAASYSSFWSNNAVTAENLKERPYTNLYAKLTTRSNTFKVHVRSQSLRKARSSSPGTFDETVDSVVGEYRGSAVVERYLDQAALAAMPTLVKDYASGNATTMMNVSTRKPLDAYHRFRILSQKSFD